METKGGSDQDEFIHSSTTLACVDQAKAGWQRQLHRGGHIPMPSALQLLLFQLGQELGNVPVAFRNFSSQVITFCMKQAMKTVVAFR